MNWWLLPLVVLNIPALAWAWQGTQCSPLRLAVVWASLAILSWSMVALAPPEDPATLDWLCYGCLCLSACPVVAVLGARRPVAKDWIWVVLGYLGVLLLPLGELLLSNQPRYEALGLILLGGTLVLGMVNYLPTRCGLAALLFGSGCVLELLCWSSWCSKQWRPVAWGLILLAPVAGAWLWWWLRPAGTKLDQRWLIFRDRLGLLWAERVRELFNNAARNAGREAHLGWSGLRAGPSGPEIHPALEELLQALLQRFEVGTWDPISSTK